MTVTETRSRLENFKSHIRVEKMYKDESIYNIGLLFLNNKKLSRPY